jgi:small ligand-binding sensory domain FIST
MVRAGAGFSALPDAVAAAREAAEAALRQADLGRAEACLMFVTQVDAPEIPKLLAETQAVVGTRSLIGCTASGVLARGLDAESEPGVALLALGGLGARSFLIRDLAGRERDAGNLAVDQLGSRPDSDDLVLLLVDATGLAVRPLLESLQASLAPGVLAGAGAAGLVFGEGALASGAVAGLVVPGVARVHVTQACRPITPPLTVTRARGHWIEGLDGRPALDVYEEVARGPLAEDLRRAASFVMVAMAVAGRELDSERYRVRNVVGFSRENRAFAVPERLGRGQEIALALREPEGARDRLRSMLGSVDASDASFGLYLDCAGRGRSLFGVPGLEAGYLEHDLAGLPLVGLLAPFQLASLSGRLELLTYTGVLALLGADR